VAAVNGPSRHITWRVRGRRRCSAARTGLSLAWFTNSHCRHPCTTNSSMTWASSKSSSQLAKGRRRPHDPARRLQRDVRDAQLGTRTRPLQPRNARLTETSKDPWSQPPWHTRWTLTGRLPSLLRPDSSEPIRGRRVGRAPRP
jgi:hypothetical protein